jgi:ribosome-associated protein
MSRKSSSKGSLGFARKLAGIIDGKKGERVLIFDLRGTSPIADFFVIASGLSEIHNQTIARHLADMKKPDHVEGMEEGTWILLDYFDVIVHLFLKETREFYGLERLWGDVPRIALEND